MAQLLSLDLELVLDKCNNYVFYGLAYPDIGSRLLGNRVDNHNDNHFLPEVCSEHAQNTGYFRSDMGPLQYKYVILLCAILDTQGCQVSRRLRGSRLCALRQGIYWKGKNVLHYYVF